MQTYICDKYWFYTSEVNETSSNFNLVWCKIYWIISLYTCWSQNVCEDTLSNTS